MIDDHYCACCTGLSYDIQVVKRLSEYKEKMNLLRLFPTSTLNGLEQIIGPLSQAVTAIVGIVNILYLSIFKTLFSFVLLVIFHCFTPLLSLCHSNVCANLLGKEQILFKLKVDCLFWMSHKHSIYLSSSFVWTTSNSLKPFEEYN